MSLDIWLEVKIDSGSKEQTSVELFEANITHNVTNMWREAGIYNALYMSADRKAGDVLEVLEQGLQDMKDNPDKYEAMNASNGWGLYKHALSWLEKLVLAFKEHPKAIIKVWK